MLEKLSLRLRSLFHSRVVDKELDDELRFHVERQTEEFVRQGIPEKQAALMARRQFGNVTLHKEECRDARNWAWLENLAQDFRHSVRTLRRNAGFTVVSVVTLAVGIGATTALFSAVDTALLHPVNAPAAERLVWLQDYGKGHNDTGGNPARLIDYELARSFSAVGGFYSEGGVWQSPDGPVQLNVLRTLGDFTGVLRARVRMGRGFTVEEARGVGQPVALLTSTAFQQRFHGNAAVLNQTLRLGTAAYQIVGVLSADCDYPEEMDIWVPASRETQTLPRNARFLGIVGRLAAGVSMMQAQAEIDVISGRLAQQYADTDRDVTVSLTRLSDHASQEVRKPLLVLFSAVASVLLIGCLNIAGLLLARGIARRREAAIRVSVGAGYGRLMRLFFAESLLLAGAGCVGGLLLAFVGVDVLKAALPSEVPHLAALAVDVRVVLGGIAISLVAALVFGALPAWQFASGAQAFALKDGSASSGVGKNRVRSVLVVAEVALSVVLLVTAALLGNSFLKIRSQAFGFNSAHAYTFALELPWDVDISVSNSIAADTLARLSALPGTIAAGVTDRLPLHGGSQSNYLVVRGKTLPVGIAEKEFGYRTASPGFFAAAGIPVVAGSVYRDWQGEKGAHEAVVSQRLAALLFPGEDPVGREIARPVVKGEARWFRIVGVVGSVPAHSADAEAAAEVYVPWGATYWPLLNFVVRTERPRADVARYVHEQIQMANKSQVFSTVATLDERTAETRSGPRTYVLLAGGFALAALALSALGIFGLMAHETARRTQEIGVRLALGAKPEGIAMDAVWRSVKLVAAGLAVGVGAAWYVSELINSLLFGVEPHDVVSYAIAAAVLLGAAVLASLGPAMRAARISPIQALRHE